MSVCGIIAEFNPFHNGHHALIKAARENGAKQIVCIMSGNFVQRGSFAVTDKRVRAGAALECGADLVIELPLAHAVSTAQRFARGSVFLLNVLGCVDMLAFGSESGALEDLNALSTVIDAPEAVAKMRMFLGEGFTFAKARELAVEEIYGNRLSALLHEPNNILAIEYLRQANLQGLKTNAFTIKRVGAMHLDDTASDGFASASYLRKHPDFNTLGQFVPEVAANIYGNAISCGLFPADESKLKTAILAHLRRMSISELARLPDISEGLHNRMYSAIRGAATLDGLMQDLKTKRYTMSRIRRLVLSAFLGLNAADCETMPPYVRMLGFNDNGAKLLSQIKKRCALPVSASLAELRSLGGSCERYASLEEMSTDVYALSLPAPFSCGYEYTAGAYFCGKTKIRFKSE